MSDYHLEGPKPARMYEVILPKKLGYFGKVQEVLEDLFLATLTRLPNAAEKEAFAAHRKAESNRQAAADALKKITERP